MKCPMCNGEMQPLQDEIIMICEQCEHYTSNGIRTLYILRLHNLTIYLIGMAGTDVKTMWIHFKRDRKLKDDFECFDAFVKELCDNYGFRTLDGVDITKLG